MTRKSISVAHRPTPVGTPRLMWIVFFTSAGVMGFEISLMRLLLLASWHHFAFLVISVALLGFGASGTALSLLRSRVLARASGVLLVLVVLTAASMPICSTIAQHIPIEGRFFPALMWRQLGCWILFWSVFGLPFFLGAAAIGLTLMLAGKRIPSVYAGNLFGGAAGAILATVSMSLMPPEWLPLLTGCVTLIGAAAARRTGHGSARTPIICAAIACAVGCVLLDPPHVRLDPYKYGAYVRRLERQDQAQCLAVEYGPRAVVESYSGEVFHDLPFLSVATPARRAGPLPPQLSVVLADGHWVGSVLNIERPQQAAVVDHMMMALPYALATRDPQVLLLGEKGGINIWLARRRQASRIDVVQPESRIYRILRGPLKNRGGAVLDASIVRTIVAEPRHFVEQTADRYDLIQLAELESLSAGSGGVGGMAQNLLITREGIRTCLGRLSSNGLLSATRGIQDPPRDNLKLLATMISALRDQGVDEPGEHIVMVRDFLALCTIVKASPWTPEQIAVLRRAIAERNLTAVWFPGVRVDELNHPDVFETPPDGVGDWYYYAANKLFSSSATEFIDQWPFDIRPPTDDRPFFLDFCKLRSIDRLKAAFGDLWLTRTELAFLFVLAVAVIVTLVGGLLTLVPLGFMRSGAAAGFGPWAVTAAYFAAIGLGYLMLEITFLSRITFWIGDPVSAATITIAGFLLFSGLGSLTAQRCRPTDVRVLRGVIVALIAVTMIEIFGIRRLVGTVGSLPPLARGAVSLLAVAPLGYLMGFPMPLALARLDRGATELLPWAWGINGFASVLAAPLATAIGMTWGFTIAGALAMVLYLVPAILFLKLPCTPARSAVSAIGI